MNLAEKVGQLKQISKHVGFKVFSFNHGNDNYIVEFLKNTKVFLEKDYDSVKRRSEKLANYNKLQAEKVLWVDEDNNKLGYGEEGRLKSLEIHNKHK